MATFLGEIKRRKVLQRGAAIVVTLIVLVFEIRANTEETRAATTQAALDAEMVFQQS